MREFSSQALSRINKTFHLGVHYRFHFYFQNWSPRVPPPHTNKHSKTKWASFSTQTAYYTLAPIISCLLQPSCIYFFRLNNLFECRFFSPSKVVHFFHFHQEPNAGHKSERNPPLLSLLINGLSATVF